MELIPKRLVFVATPGEKAENLDPRKVLYYTPTLRVTELFTNLVKITAIHLPPKYYRTLLNVQLLTRVAEISLLRHTILSTEMTCKIAVLELLDYIQFHMDSMPG